MVYLDAKNPKYSNADNSSITLEVNFNHLPEEYVEFNADPNDSAAYSKELFDRAVAGDFGDVAAYEPPSDVTGEAAMAVVRHRRNQALAETDYVMVADYFNSLTTTKQEEWTAYRSALRDLPASGITPVMRWNESLDAHELVGVTWPTKPGA